MGYRRVSTFGSSQSIPLSTSAEVEKSESDPHVP